MSHRSANGQTLPVAALDNQGTYHTINYYPKEEISSSTGTYSYNFTAQAMGSRSIFIVSADAQVASQLNNPPGGYFINNLPSGTQDASIPITTTRTA